MKKQELVIASITVGFIIASIVGFRACHHFANIDAEQPLVEKSISTTPQTTANVEKPKERVLYWHTIYDDKLQMERLVCDTLFDIEPSSTNVIELLNKREAECKIIYKGIKGDTIVIGFTNEEYLTEEMGTTGTDCFLAETVYTLTEIAPLKFVFLDIAQGSHAGAGVICRETFSSLLIN
ncbi:MAG: hypothetical protein ACRC3G_05755 [Bacteroidales bacterium]